MTLYNDLGAVALRMERLREMHDEGEIGAREFKREYGALSRQLLGDKEYEHQRKRKRLLRRRLAERQTEEGLPCG